MESVTKRLHISGLTSQITSSDLSSRFSSFGTVKSLDGLGKLDGNGAVRPYAYVTLESTKSQLAKCVNLLSGTTWKGAKLRIGDAKPDFRARIEEEHTPSKRPGESEGTERPKKRKRLLRGCQGVHAADMSLVTPQDTPIRSGWRKTPLGRLIRPMRMRPTRPLPEVISTRNEKRKSKGLKGTSDEKGGKKKKKGNVMITRARRRTIDPTRWGSQSLKGILLEGNGGNSAVHGEISDVDYEASSAPEDGEETEEMLMTATAVDERQVPQNIMAKDVDMAPSPVISVQPVSPVLVNTAEVSHTSPEETNFAREVANTINLLDSLFGDRGDQEWGGEESLSDIDTAKTQARAVDLIGDNPIGYEEVPIDHGQSKPRKKPVNFASEPTSEETLPNTSVIDADSVAANIPEQPARAVQMTKLKDMFTPREEDVGFSLLGNLDIDLELDDDLGIPTFTTQAREAAASAPKLTTPASTLSASVILPHNQIAFDPTKSLFFPRTANTTSTFKDKDRTKDIFDAFKERGWGPDAGFYRTESTDEIRKRWEDAKVELTHVWKRRHREAVKSVRRRGGAGDRE